MADETTSELGSSTFVPSTSQRLREKLPELQQAEKNMTDTIANLNKIINRHKEKAEDDCDSNGKIIISLENSVKLTEHRLCMKLMVYT